MPVRILACAAFLLSMAVTAWAAEPSLPASFKTQTVKSPAGADIYVRYGGAGPAVVLIHGFGDTGEMWGPLAAALMKDHFVIVPDLRGMGHSSKPSGGYDKKTQAQDIRAAIVALGQDRASVVGHDIGNMVAYAYVAQFPDKVDKFVLMDAPLPGINPWDEIIKNPALWHFNFNGPDVERLVAGRERIFLDRFYNEFGAHPERIDEDTRNFYAKLYAQPGAMHSAFEQFKAFRQDAEDNRVFSKTRLTMPVLAIGGEKSFGPVMAQVMRNAAIDVQEAVVLDSGHWIMEENPDYAVKLIVAFIDKP